MNSVIKQQGSRFLPIKSRDLIPRRVRIFIRLQQVTYLSSGVQLLVFVMINLP
jgi:hypothetical protein